jgi:hypothetical protein
MARLLIEGENLHLSLSGWEQLGSLHADIRVPLRHVVNVETYGNPWRILRGIRAPGTGIPGIIMLGTMRWKKKKDFCAIYKRRPVLVVNLRDEAFARLIVTCDQPEQLAHKLNESVKLS